MNERIRELAEQAGMTDDKFGMFFAKDKHDKDGVDLEKFAELIVQECAGVELYWLSEQDRKAVAEKIKEHFGVKCDYR